MEIAPALSLLDSWCNILGIKSKGWSEIIGVHYRDGGTIGHIHFSRTIDERAICKQNVAQILYLSYITKSVEKVYDISEKGHNIYDVKWEIGQPVSEH